MWAYSRICNRKFIFKRVFFACKAAQYTRKTQKPIRLNRTVNIIFYMIIKKPSPAASAAGLDEFFKLLLTQGQLMNQMAVNAPLSLTKPLTIAQYSLPWTLVLSPQKV